ncbi:OprO/OprP family phosphate-selective porin [Croceicoccus mobilis]|uniref:Porin n=1 Tax=Croceicoccus mobilis TaxID=1703339 RepID=A0A916YVK2_9SPHN|nr:porin [Croceicoccus mobilis]GGD63079.1 hypothetical protein GCM10010990_10680 [Croceicoccus mobilis]
MSAKSLFVASLMGCTALLTPSAAMAQDNAPSVSEELAQMRAAMAAMQSRIDQLEEQLAESKVQQAETAQTAAAASAAAQAATQTAEAAKSDTTVKWKGAPEMESKSGWSFKPRGRLNYDAVAVSAPSSTGHDDGFSTEARRVRIGASGDVPGGFGYKLEVNFAENEAEVTDAILTYEDKGLTITAGQHNAFHGLEEMSSSLFTSFIERTAFTDAFNLQRRIGLSAQYQAGDILLQGGAFTHNMNDDADQQGGGDARVVYSPKMGETQLHFGGSFHYTNLDNTDNTVRYRQRPEVHATSTRFVDTGNFEATSETGYGVEAAAIMGPFHVATEGRWQKVSRPGLADPTFFGGYVEAGFFLTKGDHRTYKKGIFDRVKPANPVGKGGMGALQVNVRYDYLDLTDAGIVGGTQNQYDISLIWTPTDHTRLLFGYAHIELDDAVYPTASGSTSYGVDSFGARAQIDF